MVLQMIPDKSRALIIFARTPAAGTVKKRLAQTIGNEAALYCYHLLLQKTVAHSREVAASRFLYFHPQKIATLPGIQLPLTLHFTLRCQTARAGLGQKMADALTETLHSDNCESAVLIGSDIPFLETNIIEQAFSRLAAADIVLGPARDGGYYLIGLQRQALKQAKIFANIPWGTDQAFKTTVTRARISGLTVATLTPLFDVDTLDDLKKWQQQEKDPEITLQLSDILQKETGGNRAQSDPVGLSP